MTPGDAATGFRHFHEQLAQLKQRLIDMSDHATALIDLAVDALLTRDQGKAEAVIAGDRELDALEVAVEDQAIGLLALQQPMARDLRFIISAIKVSNDLERVTQVAKNMVMRFGMSEKLGPRVLGRNHDQPFLGRDMGAEPDYSEEIAREIDDEVRRLIEESDDPAGTRSALERRQPLGRLVAPEEVAKAVAFLAADSTFTTGQDLLLDGGITGVRIVR